MRKYLGIYILFLVTLVTCDMVWLLVVAKNLYHDEMGDLIAADPKLLAGIAFLSFVCTRRYDICR